MERRNPNLRPKEGHQPRDRTGGRVRWWDSAGRANTVPRQLPPFPSSHPHQRQPQDSQTWSLPGDSLSSPSSTLTFRNIRSHSGLAQGAQEGKGPPWSSTCPGPANSTAARSKGRRVSCWACSGRAKLDPRRQQHKDHRRMDEALLAPQRCSHVTSHVPAPAAAAAGGSHATPANPPLCLQAYEGESSPGPEQEAPRCVKQETQPEIPAREADSAVPQHAEQETQTEEQNSAAPLLVNQETQTETPAQEEEDSPSPELIDKETQSEAMVTCSPSALSSVLSIAIEVPARQQRLSLFRRALRALCWASWCPCLGEHHGQATGAGQAPGDGFCSELAKHPWGGTAGTVAVAAPKAFPAAKGTALPPYSWPWLIETSL